MQELKMLLGNSMMLFFFIILIANILITASDFAKKYKSMKRKARKYERLIKMGGNLYV